MSQLVRDNSGGDTDGGDGVSPYPAQVVDEWVATSGPGQKKAVGWEWVLRAQQTETMDQFADEGIHRDHALGFRLDERHMDDPGLWAYHRKTIKGQVRALPDAHAGVT